ncbi:mitochondrial RNA pseudouridine synthase Rpusd4-like [Anneissia japonica]|uniref:mitochondrial RNA pseudouridine synthase Rpusd4-like n=1 Tax=Anneissia japonica TaxID=1529436 RepID=UPI0014257358|nr:mitochondrial RNA pseudouridine synthase Rpusd4-like [Anneissia japonica]
MVLFSNLNMCIRTLGTNSFTKCCVYIRRSLATGKVAFLPRKLKPTAQGLRTRQRCGPRHQNLAHPEQSNSKISSEKYKVTNTERGTLSFKEKKDDTIYIEFDGANLKKNKKNVDSRPSTASAKDGIGSAKAAAMKVRDSLESENQKRKKVGVSHDSKGFKVYTNAVQDLKRLPPGLVTSILRSRVIYNEGDIIAIDKPYGLPCHGGPGVVNNIEDMLPRLVRMLPRQHEDFALHMVHRLDKETTGVMLFAKTEEMKRKLQAMFRNHEIIKKYWVITVGVPDPTEGIIDIPMIEKEVEGKHCMGLKPDIGAVYKEFWQKQNSLGVKSVSKFKVLDQHNSSALVQVQAVTGVKHQVRCHMAFGLGCPILGDHKYSHLNKIAPQKLPSDMLQRLKLRQAKVRTMPMHLHAHQIILPDFYKGRNLSISTRLPRFFNTNLSQLKLKV